MKKTSIVITCLLSLSLAGCNAWQNNFKHFESSAFGLKRTIVTLPPGKEPRVMTVTSKIEYNGGSIVFIDENGKTHSWPANYTWVDED